MLSDSTPNQPSASRPASIKRGTIEIGVLCSTLALFWCYCAYRHDPYLGFMWSPVCILGIAFAAWSAFFPGTYPPRLLDGSPQLRRLKQWRLGLILSAIAFFIAGLTYAGVADAPRISNLFAKPCYLCVCAWITLIGYIKIRTALR